MVAARRVASAAAAVMAASVAGAAARAPGPPAADAPALACVLQIVGRAGSLRRASAALALALQGRGFVYGAARQKTGTHAPGGADAMRVELGAGGRGTHPAGAIWSSVL